MAMSTPSWLYYLFGVLMLAVAAYCSTLLVLSLATHRPSGRDVEISHIFMGVAMAGMFVGDWAFGRSAVWELIFGALLVWFLVESIQSVRTYGLHLPHALIHAVMNFAMLLMYWFPLGRPLGGHVHVSLDDRAEARSRARLHGGLHPLRLGHLHAGLPQQGRVTLRKPCTGLRPGWCRRIGSSRGSCRGGAGAVVAIDEIVATPWLVDLSHVVMCIAMGFMLLLMT